MSNVDEHTHNKGYNKQKNQHTYFTIFICTEHDISPYMMWSKTSFPVIPPSITPAIITAQLRRTHAKICFCFVFILIYLLNFRLSFLQYYHLIVIKLLWQIPIEISPILRNLITVIFCYQISHKPLKILSLWQVSFPLYIPLCYIVPSVFTDSGKGKSKGNKII